MNDTPQAGKENPQPAPSNQEYSFTLYLVGMTDFNDADMERLYTAGCHDATFASRHGRVVAEFTREAASHDDAIRSAVQNICDSGLNDLRDVSLAG